MGMPAQRMCSLEWLSPRLRLRSTRHNNYYGGMWEVAGGVSLPPAENRSGCDEGVRTPVVLVWRPPPCPVVMLSKRAGGGRRENGELYLSSGFDGGGLSFLQHRGVMKLMNPMNARRMMNAAIQDEWLNAIPKAIHVMSAVETATMASG